jgi:hypothetical protein
MTLRNKLKQPGVQIRIGLMFLILASLSKWFLRPTVELSDGWTDGITGLLYGVSIGFMLLGIWRKSRRGPGEYNN